MTTLANQTLLIDHVTPHSAGFHVAYFRIKMVFKSAYQRSFRGPKWDDFTVDEFQRKNQYRADRRSVEHQHQAWLWDSDGEEDVEEIPMPEPSHKKQEVKQVTNTRNEPNDNERRQSIKAWVDEQQGISGEEGKKIEEEKEPRIGDRKVDPSRQLRNRNETDEAKHRHNRTTYPKHRFPQRKLHFNMKERESFGPDDIDEKKKHPPFLPYGWANDAPTEFRKTHNVLASDPEVCLLFYCIKFCLFSVV